MRRSVCTALAIGLASSAAQAAIVYEPFDYEVGNLGLNTNPSTGTVWYSSAASGADDRVQVVTGNLSVPGMPASIGNMISYGGPGRTDRLFLGRNYTSGSVYYSVMMKVTDLAGTLAGGATIAGFNNTAQSAANHDTAGQPTAISGRLLIKPIDTSTYQIGASKASANTGDFVFTPLDSPYNVNDTVFIVGRYTFNTASGQDDVFDMWINPAAGTFADDDAIPDPTITMSGGNDGGQIATFIFRQNNNIVPAGLEFDELRVDTTWAHVTSNLIPEPASLGLLVLAAAGMVRRRGWSARK